LIHDVAALVQLSCEHFGVTLELGTGTAPVTVLGHEASLRAAVLNLVQNAIEAAGPGGRVVLEVQECQGEPIIQIKDTGSGPPPEIEATICEPFVTAKPEGVGLGLALARQVAEAHDGTLSWARVGGWTRFRLRLPRARAGTIIPTS
jgi:signal transduction histidine kinase